MAVPQTQSSQNPEIAQEPTNQLFTHFDVVTDHSDHYYAGAANAITPTLDTFSNGSSRIHKRIMKEWKILEKGLPETIYVRVYETRINLLRAVIIGSDGTPYHDGLFFFDIAFPPDYPNKPPLVHYCSFGLRVNPNLYESGHVCLSLLDTWIGRRIERWNPNESTVLQVLVSLQALVLNEKPYYNEAGIGLIPGKVKKSLAYNDKVFILSCKTMLFLLRRPPMNFEEFIARHFRERGTRILTICDDYINGRARVGQCGVNGSGLIKVSKKLKRELARLSEELVVGFTKNGASPGHFCQLREKKEMASSKERKVEKTASLKCACGGAAKGKRSATGKIIEKIKKLLGLNKDGKGKEECVVDGEERLTFNKKVKILPNSLSSRVETNGSTLRIPSPS